MKVSIIVPVCCVEAYLPECIGSVLHQSYQNYELVLVDDGSTDRSGAICDAYSARYPNSIKVLHIPNSGPLYARLQGIQAATGDILLFLDGDDTLRRDALEVIVHTFDPDCDMVLFDAEPTPDFPSKPMVYPYPAGQVCKQSLYTDVAEGTFPNSVWSKAIRRECAGMPEHFAALGKVKYGEDLLLSAEFITNAGKIVYLKEGLYHYRCRPGSAVVSVDAGRKDCVQLVHREMETYIEKWNMPELKPLHDARKVRGWMLILRILLKNRSGLTAQDFRMQLHEMAEAPYFSKAYEGMDASRLSQTDRMLAFFLLKKQYYLFYILSRLVGASK